MLILFLQAAHGLGHHADTVSFPDLVVFAEMSFVQSVVALVTGLGLLKIAIALELLKFKSSAWNWYTGILWGLIGNLTCSTPSSLLYSSI